MILTLAAGGILTEILSDTSSIILPSSEDEILECLNELKISKIIRGYRGGLDADVNQLLDAIMKIKKLVWNNKDKSLELDIKPLMVTTAEVR